MTETKENPKKIGPRIRWLKQKKNIGEVRRGYIKKNLRKMTCQYPIKG